MNLLGEPRRRGHRKFWFWHVPTPASSLVGASVKWFLSPND